MCSARLPSHQQVGGKAAVLFELQAAGFRVPPFEIVTAAIRQEELVQVVERLGFPLAVRSSATAEDGRESSFAGQFQSYLNLRSLADVERAVQDCCLSLSSPGLAAYCEKQGIDPAAIRMSVIVQRMIEPELAGVAFTVNPATGAEEVTIEACAGIADGLLAGTTKPLPAEHPLLSKHAADIITAAKRIQRHFGAPQDIEFAIADGTLYILQARPITRIQFAPEIGEWTNADFRDGGVSSSVCSPLMWSLYDLIWDHSLKNCLREIHLLNGDFTAGQMFFGRPYWNLGAVKRAVARIPGFKEREFDQDLQVDIQYDGDGERTPLSFGNLLRALPTLWALPGFLRRQRRAAERLLSRSDEVGRNSERRTSDPVADFRQLIKQDYFSTETTYFRTIFAVSLAKLDFKEWFPDCNYPALVAALPPISHLAPIRRMRERLARGESDIAPLVQEFRHQCRFGIDIRHPRWDEDIPFVAQLFASLPIAAESEPGPAYEQARCEASARLPRWQRPFFARKLDRLRQLVWLREELRDLSSRLYYHLRRLALAIAEQRGIGDDVYFQTFEEIYVDDRSQIAARREVFEGYRNFAAPNEIGSRYVRRESIPTGALRGIGASGGRATGIARVARNVEEALLAEPGTILICPFTEPGWTVVLDRVAGVVTETGGQLSHAAVICREFGIPAVLGVARATQRIVSGVQVTIDGHAGLVTIN